MVDSHARVSPSIGQANWTNWHWPCNHADIVQIVWLLQHFFSVKTSHLLEQLVSKHDSLAAMQRVWHIMNLNLAHAVTYDTVRSHMMCTIYYDSGSLTLVWNIESWEWLGDEAIKITGHLVGLFWFQVTHIFTFSTCQPLFYPAS